MGTRDEDAMRMIVRHQWVREHGTPRVTTLAGRRDDARALWLEWIQLTGRTRAAKTLFEQPVRSDTDWIDNTARKAMAAATATPREPIAIVVEPALVAAWLGANEHRLSAFIGEGLVTVNANPNPNANANGRSSAKKKTRAEVLAAKARSWAELSLFEALEATAATAGRFELNQPVSFQFGSRACEIDLLSRGDELALEVDGFHHFTNAEGYRRDRRKDLILQANGYAVLRFLAEDVLTDPIPAVQLVVEFLGRRLARRRVPRKNDHAT
jgi:very-short-patch-repair endonuclease